jgi:DNA (cytosine-5)-methyltransferase 1
LIRCGSWVDHLASLEEHHTAGVDHGLRYRVVFQKVDAADFGVPQHRERVIIVGFRWDIHEPWSFPKATHSGDALDAAQWLYGTYWDEHHVPRTRRPQPPAGMEKRLKRIEMLPFSARWRTVRDALKDLPHPQSPGARGIRNHNFQPGARTYTGHTGSLFDAPAKTLKAGDHGVPGGENMLADANGSVRYFTVRESARLQTFPDWYHFPNSWTESMRQIGNAVPVTLGRVIGSSVANTLREHRRLQPVATTLGSPRNWMNPFTGLPFLSWRRFDPSNSNAGRTCSEQNCSLMSVPRRSMTLTPGC